MLKSQMKTLLFT